MPPVSVTAPGPSVPCDTAASRLQKSLENCKNLLPGFFHAGAFSGDGYRRHVAQRIGVPGGELRGRSQPSGFKNQPAQFMACSSALGLAPARRRSACPRRPLVSRARNIAYSAGANLYLVSPDGNDVQQLASLPGEPIHLVWSPDGKYLRFALEEQNSTNCALWQLEIASKTVRRLLPDEYNSATLLAGGWTPDDRYFFYASGDAPTENIWAMRQEEMLRRASSQPMQITTGPLGFFVPLSGQDGKTVYSVGQQLRGQLVRYEAPTKQFVPYAQGISADHITFSRDGWWMVTWSLPTRSWYEAALTEASAGN